MTNDPFAPAPAPAATQTVKGAPVSTPVGSSVVPSGDGKVVVTLKGGSGFDAPWIVIHADSVQDALRQFDEDLASLMERAQQAASKFSSLSTKPAPQQAPSQRPNTAPPAGATQAPAGQTETCAHGEMIFRSGISKAGKPYKMFACPERDRNAQCPPVWVK